MEQRANEQDRGARSSLFRQVLSEASEPFDVIFGHEDLVRDCHLLQIGDDAIVVESRGSTLVIPLRSISRVQLTKPATHGYSR